MDFDKLKNELSKFDIKPNLLTSGLWKKLAKFINDNEEIYFCTTLTSLNGKGVCAVSNTNIYALIPDTTITLKNNIIPLDKVASSELSIKGISINDGTKTIELPLPKNAELLQKTIQTRSPVNS